MVIIKNKSGYTDFLSFIRRKDVFIHCVKKNHNRHPINTEVMLFFIKVLKTDDTFVFNVSHQDTSIFEYVTYYSIIHEIIKTAKRTFVIDKKSFIHLTREYDVEDLLIYEFDLGETQPNLDDFQSDFQKNNRYRFHTNDDFNSVIPLTKHLECFENIVKHYRRYTDRFTRHESYQNLNGIITETLAEIEFNGLHVDKDLFNYHFSDKNETPINDYVYTEYNLFTATGRPSNRFNGINYAALNKENGCRSVFNSRFGKDGMLITMDYSAYHPHIIANLINFDVDLSTNIYDYLGRYYFHLNRECNEEEIKKSKNLTFINLYGGVRREFEYIPYFQKTAEYIRHRWQFFNDNGYIETPIFKRRLTPKHLLDGSPNKLFNYILQSSETEFSIKNINTVNRLLKDRHSKIVLYTYDSVLIDACKDDGIDVLRQIKETMVDNKFPVKCYAGTDYNNSTLIAL